MEKTADIKVKIDEIISRDYNLRNIIAKAMLETGHQIIIEPTMDSEGRIKSEKLIIYRIEKVVIEEKEEKQRRY